MVRIIGSLQKSAARSDQLQWLQLARSEIIPNPLPETMLSLYRLSSLKMLKNRM